MRTLKPHYGPSTMTDEHLSKLPTKRALRKQGWRYLALGETIESSDEAWQGDGWQLCCQLWNNTRLRKFHNAHRRRIT